MLQVQITLGTAEGIIMNHPIKAPDMLISSEHCHVVYGLQHVLMHGGSIEGFEMQIGMHPLEPCCWSRLGLTFQNTCPVPGPSLC